MERGSTVLKMMVCKVSILQISVLMRQKLQHQNGAFVIPIDGPIPVGFEIPGTIRYVQTSPVVTFVFNFAGNLCEDKVFSLCLFLTTSILHLHDCME